jgi:hypothetical protein
MKSAITRELRRPRPALGYFRLVEVALAVMLITALKPSQQFALHVSINLKKIKATLPASLTLIIALYVCLIHRSREPGCPSHLRHLYS